MAMPQITGNPNETAGETPQCQVSVVFPVFNEVESLPELVERIEASLNDFGRSYEIIAVDDGSTDGTRKLLAEIAAENPKFKVVFFARNFGQTAALMAGLDHATGEVIVTIDSDLQNDPADIPKLVEKLDEGYDLVNGWRKDRQDAKFRRNMISRVANRIISYISGVTLRDYGCTLKAYRSSVIAGMRLYGEMHRFIPIYASWYGARIVEVPVGHSARSYGASKYGLERIFKVILDLLLIQFMHRHMARPIHLFGGIGLLFLGISSAAFVLMVYLKLFHDYSMISTPLPMMTSLFLLLGVNTLLLGLIAEILMRTYFESRGEPHYIVREVKNIHPGGA